jgi:hypothetical protein
MLTSLLKKEVPTLPSRPIRPQKNSPLTHVNTAADIQYHLHAHKRDPLYTESKDIILCYWRSAAITRTFFSQSEETSSWKDRIVILTSTKNSTLLRSVL